MEKILIDEGVLRKGRKKKEEGRENERKRCADSVVK
jgi:hypothetical protein